MAAAECRSCQAEIHWCEKWPVDLNDKGLPKTIPINADSVDDPKGNIEIWSEEIPSQGGTAKYRVYRARYLRQGQVPAEGHHRGISHFATCKQAPQWRGRK